jgi:hypothetical protein
MAKGLNRLYFTNRRGMRIFLRILELARLREMPSVGMSVAK